ncbi:MAG: CvpA family protein [Pirellulaceae bacterium]|nr:CvpA family protein [Pirellulaceae bacterium]MDP6554663.1 CvpA family protein [Pirellulaceae bacterium]
MAATMQVYDIIMIVVLLGTTMFGAYKGLAWQVASLAAVVASYLVAMNFRDDVAKLIDATPPWNVFLAMLILYVGTSFAIWIGFRYVSKFLDRVKLREFDRQLGGLLGFAKGTLFCVIITLFAMTLLGDTHRRAIVQSRSGYYIAVVLDKSHTLMPSELHDVLHPYLHSLDERVDHTGHDHDSADDHRRDEDEASGRLGLGGVELIPADDLLDVLKRRASDTRDRQIGDDPVRR